MHFFLFHSRIASQLHIRYNETNSLHYNIVQIYYRSVRDYDAHVLL